MNALPFISKPQVSDVLKHGAKLAAIKLNKKEVACLISKTKQKQAEILKLKEVDQEKLRMIIQL